MTVDPPLAPALIAEQLCIFRRSDIQGRWLQCRQLDELPRGEVGVMLRMVVGGLLGFVVAFVVALLLMGHFWPSMPYEVALPMLLAVGWVALWEGLACAGAEAKRFGIDE